AINNCDNAFFIDKTGRKVISGDFKYASSFSGGLSRVDVMTKNGLFWGYIDKKGKMVWGLEK
ncbi:MAG TPA: WG repeat-containing protein, partial [Blastocatellia bacterium]|nr:WG repeat-containing protein [Blastocatellia bacterium]